MKVLLIFVTIVSVIYSTTAVVVPNVKLNTGEYMPQIGLGTWNADEYTVFQSVMDALEIGYRHIDLGNYIENEIDKEIGEALHTQIRAGVVKREDVFITIKVSTKHSNDEMTLANVKNSLERLNLTYVDLVLVNLHEGDVAASYKGLEAAFEQKLTRSIGVSNFYKTDIEDLLKTAKVIPTVNQVPFEKEPHDYHKEIFEICNKLGISVTVFTPRLNPAGFIADELDMTLGEIGQEHNKTPTQLLVRYNIQKGLVVIPKITDKAYIKENFEVFDFELSSDEMKNILGIIN